MEETKLIYSSFTKEDLEIIMKEFSRKREKLVVYCPFSFANEIDKIIEEELKNKYYEINN